ncbi:SOS response-associated peptidase [Pseudidiomarina marina]|uniref:Abasic site processing protein n=1 Tax=Pseudidiomarina marina TaxID=502366 RepID=A0A432YDZ2_9GAMM|nr:SOS response-associated peptidase [Pseudidiomarina marina]RUO59219.1 DUF159 family protein [Pseudidiomarina marina]
MCGRLNVVTDPLCQLVTEQLGLKFHAPTNQDLRPTQQVEVITTTQRHDLLHQLSTEWGIQPSWANRILINAQAETVATKRTFQLAFKQHRCVVPCSGWYEWQQQEGQSRKTKYLFSEATGQPLYMAGIYFPHVDSRAQLVTLTTAPTEQCAAYHHRMPLLIRPTEVEFWLNSQAEALTPLLAAPEDIALNVVAR